MIEYSAHQLANGLKIIVHPDPTVQTAVLNLIYNVGSKDEEAHKTGFAHLFEHLMFGGSKHCPDFDGALQNVGGENNAFTSADVTNYYITVPSTNLETAFWLESDRMAFLNLDANSLEVQRKVVIEEFKQRYLNQPYGDAWLKLRPLAYDNHSYSWPTIGKEISHIENATLQDVDNFHQKYYSPNNATLVVGGNVEADQVLALANQYFGELPTGSEIVRDYGQYNSHRGYKSMEVEADVPQNAIYMTFNMANRMDLAYYSTDLLSDILGRGKSSLLHKRLVIEKEWMTTIGASVTGSFLPGLLVISGRLVDGITFEQVEQEIFAILTKVQKEGVEEFELQKVKNEAEASIVFGRVELLERCIALAYANLLGDTELVNYELERILAVTAHEVKEQAQKLLVPENCSVLYYKKAHLDEEN
jgi:zinc protease